MILRYLLSGMLMFPFTGIAQQLPLFTQYREYYSFLNPAFVNQEYYVANPESGYARHHPYLYSFRLSHRQQWTALAFQEQQISPMFSADILFPKDSSEVDGFIFSGGGHLLSFISNPLQRYGVYLRMTAWLAFNQQRQMLGIGFNAGAILRIINPRQLHPFHINDPQLADPSQQHIAPDGGFGLYYRQQIGIYHFFGGVSIPQLFDFSPDSPVSSDRFAVTRIYHLYLLGGVTIDLHRGDNIEFSFWGKDVANAQMHWTFNGRLIFNNAFWLGTGYSPGSFFHAESGFYHFFECDQPFKKNLDGGNRLSIGFGFDLHHNAGVSLGPSLEVNIAYTKLRRR